MPLFLSGESLLVANPTNAMKEEDKLMAMRDNNPNFSMETILHGLLARHHVQFFVNNRFEAFRNFGTPFRTQGKAVYWEFLLRDLKFPQSPKDKIGMFLWRMYRCAGIRFLRNYHLSK